MADSSSENDQVTAYVRGELSQEQAERFEAALQQDPALAADLALTQKLRQLAVERAQARADTRLGWARLERAVDSDATATRLARRPTWWQTGALAACAVLVWQLVVVSALDSPGTGSGAALEMAGSAAAGWDVAVAFEPSATEQTIRELLRAVDGQLVNGPTALGLYHVRFASEAGRTRALGVLSNAAAVESATVR